MIVAGYARLGYSAFAVKLAPIAMAGLVIDYAIIALHYRRQLGRVHRSSDTGTLRRRRFPRWFMMKSVLIALGVLVGSGLGFPAHLVALTAGAISLLTRRIKPERVYKLVDWTMLLMFGACSSSSQGRRAPAFRTASFGWSVAHG